MEGEPKKEEPKGEPAKEILENGASPEAKFPIKRICAWCGKLMGYMERASNNENDTTHGMCPECFKKEREKLRNEPPMDISENQD